MTATSHKIETAAGTIRTRTASRFVGVRVRERDVFVAHAVTTGGSWVRVGAGHTEAEAREAAARDIATRRIENVARVEVDCHKAFAEVVKRSDTFAVAEKAVAKAGGGFVFDTVTGERV